MAGCPHLNLPSSRLQKLRLFETGGGEAFHGPRDLLADLGQNLRVVEEDMVDYEDVGVRSSNLDRVAVSAD
jgi:hypothetical protein